MVTERSIGLNFTPANEATMKVWAPGARSVAFVKKEGTEFPLSPGGMGFWTANRLPVSPGEDYHLSLDGKLLPDPASLLQPEGVHKASCAVNLRNYMWSDNDWQGVPMEQLVIYELHTGTFTPEGTFKAIIAKLDYLKETGITAIELMPVAQFPGTHNWGYDGVYPFAVQNSYGGPAELQHLVDVCHQKGLAVILDVVYNHLGPEGNYLPAYGPVFTDKYKTPWGQAINYDDEWSDGVRTFFIENVLMWLRDFHIDGLRLDAIHAIRDFGAVHILREMKLNVEELNRITGRNHFLICESDLNDVKFISPFEQGGCNLDATWCDEFHHSLHSLVTGETNGYYSDFGGINLLVKAFNDAYVFDGTWSEHRKRTFGSKATGIPGHKFVVFTQNHDQVGNRMLGERLSTLVNFELLKVAAGTLLVSPFTPLLFMGEEYGETRPFQYFTNHGDKELIRLVREGRKKEFKEFMALGEAPDPDDIETFNASKLNWEHRSPNQKHIYSFYKELIYLRKTMPALQNTQRDSIKAEAIGTHKALFLSRKSASQSLLAFINFEDEAIPLQNIPETEESNWQLLLNSSDERWGGSGSNASLTSIPAQSICLWVNS